MRNPFRRKAKLYRTTNHARLFRIRPHGLGEYYVIAHVRPTVLSAKVAEVKSGVTVHWPFIIAISDLCDGERVELEGGGDGGS